MINVSNLKKSYGMNVVLDGISFALERGVVYGIVGENGAGKTTLFKCIAGLENYSGRIESTIEPLKNHLGFLPTNPYFFSKMTGREYLNLLCHARQIPIENMEERNIFDLPLHQYASTYSTGMKKKLALTGILLQENEVFILDEPFNGVDIQSNIIITEIIHQLKALNKIILIASHIFSTLNDTCDRIHLLRKGKFAQTVTQESFNALEATMKQFTIGDRIQKLNLR